MTPALTKPRTRMTVADLYERFGPIPLDRIRFDPWPGTATEQDVLDIYQREKRRCELVDGILLEKDMGYPESMLAMALGTFLYGWVHPRKLGIVAGEAGMVRLASGLVRIPDVSFVSWDKLPNRRIPREPIPNLAPDLAVEVLSPSNTAREMANKLREFFQSGVRIVWVIDPRARTVAVYTSPQHSVTLTADQTLDGGDVLPGFTLPLQELFAELDEEAPPPTAK
jgi:Uma2 family endonuclease